jgi:YVTN family beta-propeller protein
MSLNTIGTIAIPSAAGSEFDHAAFDAKSRRVFIAHTTRDCIEVIDHDAGRHLATLPGFPGAAGAVADDGHILVTNRGSASIALLDASTLETRATYKTGGRPNGAVIVARSGLGIAACIGVDGETPTLQVFGLSHHRHVSIDLPGRPRWCVTDADAERIFLCVREPSMVLVARLPDLGEVTHWKIPSSGAHGLDIDHSRGRLYVACDDATLVEMSCTSGEVTNVWPIGGPPDVTFFNPATGLVHVAIGEPGLVDSIDPRNGHTTRTVTGAGAHTTALVARTGFTSFHPRMAESSSSWTPDVPTRELHRRINMKWITREKVKVDRVACPWLIKKFVDKDAEFVFVPGEKVMAEAKRLDAIPYDVKDVELGHHGKECSFEAILKKYKLTGDPALVLLGRIVNGADTDNTLYHQPEGPGLEAIAEGFRHLGFKDDHEHNAAEWIVYDALYAYCGEMVKRGKPNGDFLN